MDKNEKVSCKSGRGCVDASGYYGSKETEVFCLKLGYCTKVPKHCKNYEERPPVVIKTAA